MILWNLAGLMIILYSWMLARNQDMSKQEECLE